jgi:hypothetical protein
VSSDGPRAGAASKGLQTGDFTDFERCDHKGSMAAYDEHMQSACQVMEAAEAGTLPMAVAVEILAALSQNSWSQYRESSLSLETPA